MLNKLFCSNENCGKKSKSPKLLGQAYLSAGTVIELKCSRCGAITSFQAKPIEEQQ